MFSQGRSREKAICLSVGTKGDTWAQGAPMKVSVTHPAQDPVDSFKNALLELPMTVLPG